MAPERFINKPPQVGQPTVRFSEETMATPQDADLIIKLYDLRRDETMRKARNFFTFEFFPKSADDVKALFTNIQEHPEHNAYLRQVVSYWEMVAAMVNHGSIDWALFFDTNGEFFGVCAM